MRASLTLLVTCVFVLSGCELLFPRRGTTAPEVQRALEQCGIAPDQISWRVRSDGVFMASWEETDPPVITEGQAKCLKAWVSENRIKAAFVGSELHPR